MSGVGVGRSLVRKGIRCSSYCIRSVHTGSGSNIVPGSRLSGGSGILQKLMVANTSRVMTAIPSRLLEFIFCFMHLRNARGN
jgi:hypothetical protein